MTLAVIIVICVVLFLLAVVCWSPAAAARGGAGLGAGARTGRKAPGKLGWLFSKPFSSAREATDKSGGAGRRLGQRLRS